MSDTDKTTVPTTDDQAERDDRMMYASSRLSLPMALAALTGQREGLIAFEDLPWDMADGAPFLAAVHKVLDESGSLAAYRAEVASEVVAAACPFWCEGRHPTVYEAGDIIIHAVEMGRIEMPATPEGEKACTVVVQVSAAQKDDGTCYPPMVDTLGDDELPSAMTAKSTQSLGEALTRAAGWVEQVAGATV